MYSYYSLLVLLLVSLLYGSSQVEGGAFYLNVDGRTESLPGCEDFSCNPFSSCFAFQANTSTGTPVLENYFSGGLAIPKTLVPTVILSNSTTAGALYQQWWPTSYFFTVQQRTSGLAWVGLRQGAVFANQIFEVGRFTHMNQPTSYSATIICNKLTLSVSFKFTDPLTSDVATYTLPIPLLIEETPNTGCESDYLTPAGADLWPTGGFHNGASSCPYGPSCSSFTPTICGSANCPAMGPCLSSQCSPGCSDRVSLTTRVGDFVFPMGGKRFFVSVEGFSVTPSSPPIQEFITTENQNNQASLYARLVQSCTADGQFTCDDGNSCSDDVCNIVTPGSTNSLGYRDNYCTYFYNNSRCPQYQCRVGTCGVDGCAYTTNLGLCNALSPSADCRTVSCTDLTGWNCTYPQIAGSCTCPGGVCQTNGVCFCPTTTTTKATTTTTTKASTTTTTTTTKVTTTTLPYIFPVVPTLRCSSCSSTMCIGTMSYDASLVASDTADNSQKVVYRPISTANNVFRQNNVVLPDYGQPEYFYRAKMDNAAIFSWSPVQKNYSWTIDSAPTSSVTNAACPTVTSPCTYPGEISTYIVDSSTTITFGYNFQMGILQSLCPSTSVTHFIINMPQCQGIAVSQGPCINPNRPTNFATQYPTIWDPTAATCFFSSTGMTTPFSIPLDLTQPGCDPNSFTLEVSFSKSSCPGVIPGATAISLLTNQSCGTGCSQCRGMPLLGPTPDPRCTTPSSCQVGYYFSPGACGCIPCDLSSCTGTGYRKVPSTCQCLLCSANSLCPSPDVGQYKNSDCEACATCPTCTGQTRQSQTAGQCCETCSACPTGTRLSSTSCQCVTCSPSCGTGQKVAPNPCDGCINCDATNTPCGTNTTNNPLNMCQCVTCSQTCPKNQTTFADRCKCEPCAPIQCGANRTLSDSTDICKGCRLCTRPSCPAVYGNYQQLNDLCSPCVPCNATVTRQTCPMNYTVNPNGQRNCVCDYLCSVPSCGSNRTFNFSLSTCVGTSGCVNCVYPPTCPANQTRSSNVCTGCTNCALPSSCPAGKKLNTSNICTGCIDCLPNELVNCTKNFTRVSGTLYNCGCRFCDPNVSPYRCLRSNGKVPVDPTDSCKGCKDCSPKYTSCAWYQSPGATVCDPCINCTIPDSCGVNSFFNSSDPCKGCQVCTIAGTQPKCGANRTVDPGDYCSCINCTACPPGQKKVTPNNLCSNCTACVAPVCGRNFTAGATICDPCVPCPVLDCGKNFRQNTTNTCAGCYECNVVCPANKTNRVDDKCICDPCVPPTCGFGFRPAQPSNTCNQTCVQCIPNCARNFTANTDPCQPCVRCTKTCPTGSYLNATDTCQPCIACNATAVNIYCRSLGNFTVDPLDACKCKACSAPICPWQTVATSDACIPCQPCDPGCNFITEEPDELTNGCSCRLCGSLGKRKVAHGRLVDPEPATGDREEQDEKEPTTGDQKQEEEGFATESLVTRGSTVSPTAADQPSGAEMTTAPRRIRPVSLCCPDVTEESCAAIAPDLAPYRCECTPCSTFIVCGNNYRLDNCTCNYCWPNETQTTVCTINQTVSSVDSCSCVDCPDPNCDSILNYKYASNSTCDGCVECVPEECALNYTRQGVLDSCDPCVPCEVPECGNSFYPNWTDLCSPCLPCNETATNEYCRSLGNNYTVDEKDTCKCRECEDPSCPEDFKYVSDNWCDGCERCVPDPCQGNHTREGVTNDCDPCSPCEVKNCLPGTRVDWTNLCNPCEVCIYEETDLQCPPNSRVDPRDICKCEDCPDPRCTDTISQQYVDPDDWCQGCEPCTPSDCPVNQTREGVVNDCDPCVPCQVKDCTIDQLVNWTDLCAPCIQCTPPECEANWTREGVLSDCLPCNPCSPPECGPGEKVDWTNVCNPCVPCDQAETLAKCRALGNQTVDETNSCVCKPCQDPLCSGDLYYNPSGDYCDGCLECVPPVCETNYTREGVLFKCEPCVPCTELECRINYHLVINEGACPSCEPCPVPNPNCDFDQGFIQDPSDSCKCIECIPAQCGTNTRPNPDNPCLPCIPCIPPVCEANQTEPDNKCLPTCPPCPPCGFGTQLEDPSNLCSTCVPCIENQTTCGLGFIPSEDKCTCEPCELTKPQDCGPGYVPDPVVGCGCVPCTLDSCPFGQIPAANLCECEVLTIVVTNLTNKTRCLPEERDACGVCFGSNRTCIGCDGRIRGPRYVDACGVVCGAGDTCGGCVGDSCTVCAVGLDLCGICGGNNTGCYGCDHVPASGKIYDRCGVCGGNGTSCLGCAGIPFAGPCASGATAAEIASISAIIAAATAGSVAAAAILWRMRQRPEIVFAEWDAAIGEYFTTLSENPIAEESGVQLNPLHDRFG